jgi:hypothetical protein
LETDSLIGGVSAQCHSQDQVPEPDPVNQHIQVTADGWPGKGRKERASRNWVPNDQKIVLSTYYGPTLVPFHFRMQQILRERKVLRLYENSIRSR